MATTLERGIERDQPVELQAAGTRRRGGVGRVLVYVLLVAIAAFFIPGRLIWWTIATIGPLPSSSCAADGRRSRAHAS